jgi:tRNA 2-selenouridine synthase
MDSVHLNDFFSLPGVILDVRSPAEFSQGRIPGAYNLPLFTNEERSQIGTTYKCMGQEEAIVQGLHVAGPKLADFASQAKKLLNKNCAAKVHCWRGGMRSASMAWLLNFIGFRTVTLIGGYKTFRRWALEIFERPLDIRILGGLTGAGKTRILQALRLLGEQILDLENLAHHRGSSFGSLGMLPQPSNEQFDNEIAMQWASFDANRPIWIEDESRMVGRCKIPDSIFTAMRQAPIYMIHRPLEERLSQLMADYCDACPEELTICTLRLSRKMGGVKTKEIVQLIEQNRFKEATLSILQYYDGMYLHGISLRNQPIYEINHQGLKDEEWAKYLIGVKHEKLS